MTTGCDGGQTGVFTGSLQSLDHGMNLAYRLPSATRASCGRVVMALAFALALSACAGPTGENLAGPAPTAPSSGGAELSRLADRFTNATKPGTGAYKIGPQDVLEINVFNVAELNRTLQVADNGSINFPLVGEISTTGKTARAVEAELAARLNARFVKSPQVSVFVKEYNSQRFTVDGSVKKPGVFPLRDRGSLLQAIALAGGLDNDSASSIVVIFRKTEAGRAAARFDLDEIRSGRAEDPAIQSGDSIVVDASPGKTALSYFTKVLPALSLFRLVP